MQTWARNAAPAFLALYLVSNLLVRSFADVWLFIGWASLCAGVIAGGWSKGSSRAFYALLTLLIFHGLAIPGSMLWGSGNWELTAGVLLWMAPALLLYLVKDAERVFTWLIPAFLVHAAWIMFDEASNGHLEGSLVATGISNNPNLAAGFLIIGIIYLLTNGKGWLAIPLLAALMLTESRWGIAVIMFLMPAMALSRVISWRPLLLGLVSVIGTVLLFGAMNPSGPQIAGYDSLAALSSTLGTDIGVRLAIPHIPSFLPSGVAEHSGLHNVPLRIAVENGILAAGLWIVITGWALVSFKNNADGLGHKNNADGLGQWKNILYRLTLRKTAATVRFTPSNPPYPVSNESEHQPQTNHEYNNGHRWILLALVLLSVLDYYTWMGHLGGFWWLLIGLLLKPGGVRDHLVDSPTPNTAPVIRIENPMKPTAFANTAEIKFLDVEP